MLNHLKIRVKMNKFNSQVLFLKEILNKILNLIQIKVLEYQVHHIISEVKEYKERPMYLINKSLAYSKK